MVTVSTARSAAISRLSEPSVQFGIQEPHVEFGVVGDQCRVAEELHQLVDDFAEDRLVGEELVRQSMNLEGFLGISRSGLMYFWKVLAGRQVVDQLDGADFDDPMAGRGVETGRFGIQNDLSHGTP